ncbi:Tropinesterase [Legionella massiliensis]|uniref:Tropinesterase n=1 Tax=Legionella massiliensis TaxID=1034943 RepID=A0A078L4W0_9GAMM|nr:alpha/beta hydrolase [Legionella massiliensis]CDZ79114.1 Tropinesterase [Legionella massiliensis]CEE14852.1 Tropinesterase [Legionella massiliensis]
MKQNYILSASKEGYHKVAYTEWGEASPTASTVICVHGLTRNSRDFDALAGHLSSVGYHVFCPDVVGRGLSSWLKNPQLYNFERYTTDMNVLIGRTGASQVDWIGTSMGGIIGMMLASLPNTPIRRLILNDVGPQIPVQSLWHMAKYVGKDPQFVSKEDAKKHFKVIYAEFGKLTEEQWDYFTEHSITERSPGVFRSCYDPGIHEVRLKWQSLKELFYSPHKALEGIIFDIDLWPFWRQIKCPVLVIRGQQSKLLLPEHLRKMQRLHSKTEVYEIADAGHAPALLEPAQHEKITAWLDASNAEHK